MKKLKKACLPTGKKVSRRDFIKRIASKQNISFGVASELYDCVIGSLIEVLEEGVTVSLTRFGTFYLQRHKGHPVKYTAKENQSVSDYLVLKFSASDTLNRQFRNQFRLE